MLDFQHLSINGFLFIGDPHMDSRTPSKRTDPLFYETVGQKLLQCAEIAKKNNLYPIILGDLLNRKRDSDPRMIVKLMQVLNAFPYRPIMPVGNHEKNHTHVSNEDVLSIMVESKSIHLLEQSGIAALFKVQGRKILVGGTEYGCSIPEKLETDIDHDFCLWLTHHDINFFNQQQDDLIEPKEILGIDLLVNGHIHTWYKPIVLGTTTFFNPGNITRMTIKDENHEPSVYSITEFSKDKKLKFERHHLKYDKKIFKVVVEEASEEEQKSLLYFTQEIKQEIGQMKTKDGSEFKDNLLTYFVEENLSESAQNIVLGLYNKIESGEVEKK